MHWQRVGNALEHVGIALATCLPHIETRWQHIHNGLATHWQRVGNALEMHWLHVGNTLAMRWQCIVNVLATHWQHVGHALATLLTPKQVLFSMDNGWAMLLANGSS